MPDKKTKLMSAYSNAIKFYAWIILANSIWFLSMQGIQMLTIGDLNSFWFFWDTL